MATEGDLWGNELLWDHLIVDSDGAHVGMVDDLELVEQGDGDGPVLTAILCGPMAFGPRIGGRLGVWWTAIGRRLRPGDEPYPPRIPLSSVKAIESTGVTLAVIREQLPTGALEDWLQEKLIQQIPGSGT